MCKQVSRPVPGIEAGSVSEIADSIARNWMKYVQSVPLGTLYVAVIVQITAIDSPNDSSNGRIGSAFVAHTLLINTGQQGTV